MNEIVSEKFGLYRVTIHQHEEGDFGWGIEYLDEDGSQFGCEGNGKAYPTGYMALKHALLRLAELFWQDLEAIAGN
ncbi:MAG TPA: hypothetical protein VLK33_22310, partial [Terriglobales bacterium]|nr:hypothetical protein [Terriglobales bacterium]